MTTETSAQIIRGMALDAFRLIDVWESEGNRMLTDFKSGHAIPMSIAEWAHELASLAIELSNHED
jgi:hypothetical protein